MSQSVVTIGGLENGLQIGQPPPGQGEIVRREDGGTSGGGWNEPVRRGEEERNVVRVAFIKGLFSCHV